MSVAGSRNGKTSQLSGSSSLSSGISKHSFPNVAEILNFASGKNTYG